MDERTLFVGDVHGCADELAALLAAAQASRVILLGDLFRKGPDPAGVFALIEEHGCEVILGNHDLRMLKHWGDDKASRRLPERAQAWLASRPLYLGGSLPTGQAWLAVHAGVHPKEGLAGTSRSQRVTMRRWPDDVDPLAPFWWQLYRGETLVIYGHDAMRGLQDHRPYTLGLDTGCIYGGALTGFLLEEGRFLQVPARAAYQFVEGGLGA